MYLPHYQQVNIALLFIYIIAHLTEQQMKQNIKIGDFAYLNSVF